MQPDHSPAQCIDEVIITHKLKSRARRAVDIEAENLALVELAKELAGPPGRVLQKLVEVIAQLCQADSAGLSLLEAGKENDLFRWTAVAGAFAPNFNETIARAASPCGNVIEGTDVVLFNEPGRYFSQLQSSRPHIYEALLVPWIVDGQTIGTIWAIDHSAQRRFDGEDGRVLKNLAVFASAAYQLMISRTDAHASKKERDNHVADRTRQLSESNKSLHQEVEQRRKTETEMRRLYELHARLATQTNLYCALDDILDAACEFTRTDRGCVQLLNADKGRLEIVAERGYGADSPFIEHFRYEGFAQGCDVARVERRRMLIEDIDKVPELNGTPAGQAARADGIRATQSTPMISRSGETIGVLSTQFRQPHRPSDDELRLIDLLAWTGADFIGRQQAEADLRQSEKRLRTLIAASTDAIYRMSPDWVEMRELDGHDFVKNTTIPFDDWLHEYIPEEDRRLVRQAVADAIRDKSIFELEHRVRRADGSVGWTLSRAVPMLDEDGNVHEWIGAATDVTQRRKAEERLREADRRKDEFLAMLAHELRNPLAPIGVAAELLQRGKMDEVRLRQTSQIIGRQVAHMTVLIDDLLDVSRVTRGLVNLNPSLLDVRHLVNDAIEQVTPLIQSRRHHLTLEIQATPAKVMGDHKRLVQVLTNLLNNAAKYTDEGGEICLKSSVHQSHVLIIVSDNGIGMSPELANRAFDLFAQGERTSDRSSGGLGLGLSLVKSLVELHAGTVGCHSKGLGSGSAFTVCLPLSEEAYQKTPDALSVNDLGTVPLKILVVDDNVDAATMLQLALSGSGHAVLVEHRSIRALERAREARPQVCLLDIGLPEMDGNGLACRLRAAPETAGAVLIAVTGYGQDSDRRRALNAGFDHHIVKPVDMRRLDAILAAIRPPAI